MKIYNLPFQKIIFLHIHGHSKTVGLTIQGKLVKNTVFKQSDGANVWKDKGLHEQ